MNNEPIYIAEPEKSAILAILTEVQRAETKHPHWPEDHVYGMAIVAEESGEAMRAAVQYEMEDGDISELRTELIQTAATCIRLLKKIHGVPYNTRKEQEVWEGDKDGGTRVEPLTIAQMREFRYLISVQKSNNFLSQEEFDRISELKAILYPKK